MRQIRFLPLLLLPALGACINLGLGTAKAPPALLTLTPAQAPAAGATMSGKANEALSVLEPQTEARLAVLRVPVAVSETKVAYLKQAQWVERPARLFQRLLAETLRARGKHLVVEGDGTTRGTILAGRLLDMGYDVRRHAAVIRYEAIRERPDGSADTRRFEAVETGIDADVDDVGPALNRAANHIAGEVADWVG